MFANLLHHLGYLENNRYLIRLTFITVFQMDDAAVSKAVLCLTVLHNSIIPMRVDTNIVLL